jgi:hypothetical protein
VSRFTEYYYEFDEIRCDVRKNHLLIFGNAPSGPVLALRP